MPYVRVPKDLSNFKPKFFFGLTSRQVVCFGSALAVGLPTYTILQQYITQDPSLYIAMAAAFPFAAFGIFRKNGLPLENFIGCFIRCRILTPRTRRYQTQCFYHLLADESLLYLVEAEERKSHGKSKSKSKR